MKEIVTNPRAWGEVADAYDQTVRRILSPFSERAIEWVKLAATDDVLDVACGPGTTTVLAARVARSVHAVDFAPEMIAILRRSIADMPHVTAEVGDGRKLDLEDGRFTAAFSMFGLMFFPDPVAGLKEIHRVLKPGGRVAISSWVPIDRSPMIRPLFAAMMHAMPPPPDQPPPEPFAFQTAESLADGLRAAGFEAVEVREVAPVFPVHGAEAYWEDTRGNIMVNHARRAAGDAWPAIEARALEHLRGSLAGVERLAMPGLIGWGRKP